MTHPYQNKDKVLKKWFFNPEKPEKKVQTHTIKVGACPSEHDEQVAFVRWLRLGGYKFTSIPNASKISYNMANRNTAEGLNAGLPDLLVIVKNKLVWVEMKKVDRRPKRIGSSGGVSEVQKEWISALNDCDNCVAHVAYGAEEAISIITRLDNTSITC